MPIRRMLRVSPWLCAVLALLLVPPLARGQAADTTDRQQLPEIAPREIEIRGELQVSFPSLQRQPLRGFASPPTVPAVSSSHTPYVTPYKQTLASLPESLPAPEAVSPSVAQPPAPQQGYVQAGGGRYTSRFVAGRYALNLSSSQTLSVNANYFGTQGFSPAGTSDLSTPADEFDGALRFQSQHDAVSVRAAAYGQADRYTLYGRPALAQNANLDAQARTGRHGGAEAQLRTFGPVDSRLALSYARTAYDTDASPSSSTTNTFSEGRLALDGRLAFTVATREAHLDASLSRSTYSGDVPSSSGYAVSGGAGAEVLATPRLTVEAGLRVMHFDAPRLPQRADAASATATFIMPDARAELALSPGLTLFAENQPRLEDEGLHGLYETNPYAEHAPAVRPTLYTTDARAGLTSTVGPLRLQALGGLQYAPSYRFFVSRTAGASTLADTPIRVGYGSARILRGGGQVALQGIAGVEASVGAYLRDGVLVDPDADIPYFSPVVAHAMLSVSFADQRGLVQTNGTIESPRPVNATSDREVDAYVAFDLTASYQVTSLLDVMLKVKDLSPQAPTRWARYARPPATVMGGFRIHW